MTFDVRHTQPARWLQRSPVVKTREQGAAFVLLLMVVVVIMATTMITLATVNESNLHLLVSQNIADKQQSIRNADAAVSIKEAAWADEMSACFSDPVNCTMDPTPPFLTDHVSEPTFWNTAQMAARGGVNYGKSQLEFMGMRPIGGDTERVLMFYRVTARATELPIKADLTDDDKARSPTVVQTMMRVCMRRDGSGLC